MDISQRRADETTYPSYGENLICDAALFDPFDHYRAIRDLGAVVRLRTPDILAIGRFADVQRALRSPEILISGEGVGFNEFINAKSDQPRTIASDGERHRKLRNVLSRPLMPAMLKQHRTMLKEMITARLNALVDGPQFDAISALAEHLPLEAVAHLVGLPDDSRAQMLRWAYAGFNVTGPLGNDASSAQEIAADIATLREVFAYFLSVDPADFRPKSWAAQLFQAVAAGRLTTAEARAALSGVVLPSLDTTVNATGNLLYNLGKNPQQWELLRSHPELIPSAVLEGVRYSAVVRWFSRVAAEDYVAEDVYIPKGERVMLIYGSANRDERHYPDPDRFDVTRNPADQLGWGTGPHMCVGMHLAKLEMEVILEAMVDRVGRIEVGAPVMGRNRTLYGFQSFPMKLYSVGK